MRQQYVDYWHLVNDPIQRPTFRLGFYNAQINAVAASQSGEEDYAQ